MENEKKIEIITISGMSKKFNVSVMTIYRKYLPELEEIATDGRKRFFSYEKAKELHDRISNKLNKYKVIA